MPELPEVETVVRYLNPLLTTKQVHEVSIPSKYSRVIDKSSLKSFRAAITGKNIISVSRRAKYILINLNQGLITIHLRMTGRLLFGFDLEPDLKHVHCLISFKDGSQLAFKDVRKFGRITYLKHSSELDQRLGIEPLSKKFTYELFAELINSKHRQIKALLLDQKLIAGLGNIYVDEVLWQAKIHPLVLSSQLSPKQLRALYKAIPKILKASIALNGTSFQSFYFGQDDSGEFVNKLKVFGREHQACKRCRSIIVKLRVSQRGTHICPSCQGSRLRPGAVSEGE